MDTMRLPPRIPEELMNEILLRLPAKSLLRFTSACREWLKIIKNPSFARDHFHRGRESTSRLAYWYGGPCNHELDWENEDDLEINEELGSVLGEGITLERYEVPDLSDVFSMHGPCYGIILVEQTNDTLALWNPTTKRVMLLPPCPLENLTDPTGSLNSEIGFGLDPVTDDLKIVLFDSRFNRCQCAIYSTRNVAWNLLEANVIYDPESYVVSNYCGSTVLNGVCYWVKLGRIHETSLLAFDMRSDSFQDIELPGILRSNYKSIVHVIDDNLALLTYDEYDSRHVHVEIWLMKEQGWTKHSFLILPLNGFQPIKSWKSNQIFTWVTNEEMIIYDCDSGNTSKIEFGKVKGSRTLFTFPCQYKESLISV